MCLSDGDLGTKLPEMNLGFNFHMVMMMMMTTLHKNPKETVEYLNATLLMFILVILVQQMTNYWSGKVDGTRGHAIKCQGFTFFYFPVSPISLSLYNLVGCSRVLLAGVSFKILDLSLKSKFIFRLNYTVIETLFLLYFNYTESYWV
jgi:hypothetical protein